MTHDPSCDMGDDCQPGCPAFKEYPMATIELSEREIIVLRSALESAEYWEHRDDLPVDSGYVLDPDMLDPGDYDVEEIKSSEAWEEVLELRALDARLAALKPEEEQNS